MNVIIPTDFHIFQRGKYTTKRAHHWSWHVWGPFSRPSGHFLSAAQMVTPTESGRKHARVDWKGRYLKFRNEARMAGAQLFHMAIWVYIWVFPRHIPFRNLKGHFLTAHTAQLYRTWISESSLTYVLLGPAGSYVSPSIHGWAVPGRITLEVSENCWLCLGWFRGNVTFMVQSMCRFFLRPIQ